MSCSQSTCGLVTVKPGDQKQLEEEFLPKAAENMLLLSRHIHNILVSQGISQVSQSSLPMFFLGDTISYH